MRLCALGLVAAAVVAVAGTELEAAADNQDAPLVAGRADTEPHPLPVSLDRIRRHLDRTPARESSSFSASLRLQVRVDVYARAPQIELFGEVFDPLVGAVPFGAPSHAEMIDVVTPREFRSKAIPLLSLDALFDWLTR